MKKMIVIIVFCHIIQPYFLSSHVTHSCHYIISSCPVFGKYLQGFPWVCLKKMTPLQKPQQSLRSLVAQQTLFTCRKSFRWLKCGVTRSSYKENDTQRVTCGDARPGEGREGWQRWSQDWVRIPWITLTCQRHYLIRPRGGFLMRKHLCAAGRQGMLESAKTA